MINHSQTCTKCEKDIISERQFRIPEYGWFLCDKCGNEYYKLLDKVSEKFLLDI